MKFVIEGRGLTGGGAMVGGLQLLPALAKRGQHEYVALLPHLPEYVGLDSPNLRVVLTPRSSNLIVREWWLNVSIPKICLEQKADALLCLGNFAPHRPPVPTVILLQHPHYVYREVFALRGLSLSEWLKVKYGREHFRHLPRDVSVIVQTEVMRERLLSQFPISPSRVFVIRDRGASFLGLPGSCVNFRKDASGPFTFLCVAVFNPHKNLGVLVEAVKRLRTLTKRPFRCLLTVDPDQRPGARKLLANIERERVGDLLVNIGSLPLERISAAYGSADAFILPTLLESFGRPYDEAMKFDLPILTSDRDFARERCQDAALYFDPLDGGSVARAMARIMEDADLRLQLVENGKRILEQIPTWDRVAARFVEVLENAVAQRQTATKRVSRTAEGIR
jgi:glycosyltransferase involved in cell wall biosynthesis